MGVSCLRVSTSVQFKTSHEEVKEGDHGEGHNDLYVYLPTRLPPCLRVKEVFGGRSTLEGTRRTHLNGGEDSGPSGWRVETTEKEREV